MQYIFPIFKAIITLAVFIAATSVASTSFQYIVVAIMGIIYITLNLGITLIQETIYKNQTQTFRLFQILGQNNPGFKEEFDNYQMKDIYSEFDVNLNDGKIKIKIETASSILILLGCLYLIFTSS